MQNNPQSFREFIGMNRFKYLLKIMIKSAQVDHKMLDHILLYGPPGLGKTTMATLISKYSGQKIKCINGNFLEKKADLLTLFNNLKEYSLLFIDEIHGIARTLQELLFSAMENNVIDLIIGSEGESKIIRFKLPPFTIIGATTMFGLLSRPFLDRFGLIWKFDYYNENDMKLIVKKYLELTKYQITEDALTFFISYTQNTPRLAKTLINRLIDFTNIKNTTVIDLKIVKKTFRTLQIYPMGLSEHHLSYLLALHYNFKNQATSLESLSNLLKDSKISIEKQTEPLLFKNNLISKNSTGRTITEEGVNFLKKLKK